MNRAFFVDGSVVVMGIQTTGKQEEYTAATGANITGDIDPDSGFDTARVVMGGGWRMPTYAEHYELLNSGTVQYPWYVHPGTNIPGRGFATHSGSVRIFMAAAGRYGYGSYSYERYSGWYWDSCYESAGFARKLYFDIEEVNLRDASCVRYFGNSVRGVLDPIP